jgi:hypothetical protein
MPSNSSAKTGSLMPNSPRMVSVYQRNETTRIVFRVFICSEKNWGAMVLLALAPSNAVTVTDTIYTCFGRMFGRTKAETALVAEV